MKPESIRTASPKSINWFMQSTPYDNLGYELPPKEMIGLMTFSFDLTIPAGEVLWTDTYTRDATWAGAAKPYRYGLRHRFPKPVGLVPGTAPGVGTARGPRDRRGRSAVPSGERVRRGVVPGAAPRRGPAR